MKQTIILGNIITVDEKKPFAKAALVKNGVFAYVGSAEEVERNLHAVMRRCWTMVTTMFIPASLSPIVMVIWQVTVLSDRQT